MVIHPKKGCVPCKTFTTSHFFRADEQAATWVPIRDAGQTRRPGRSWRQGAGREAGPERPLPLWLWQTVQEVLSDTRLLLTV